MSYSSLFVGRENSIRRCSLCSERTRFAPISVTTESSRSRGGGVLQRRCDIRGGEENAAIYSNSIPFIFHFYLKTIFGEQWKSKREFWGLGGEFVSFPPLHRG